MCFPPVPKLTRDERQFYEKLLADEEISLRAAEHFSNVCLVLMTLFGSAFFILLIAWAMA